MSTEASIAAAQSIPRRGDVRASTRAHEELVLRAADEGVSLLVFPELSLTGYELDLAEELAFVESDPRLDPLREVARRASITTVVGAPVRLGEGLHIGAWILGADGSLDVYTKHHLGAFPSEASVDGVVPPAEDCFFQPGDRNPLIDLSGSRSAVAICADVDRPEHIARAAELGADHYLVSMFVIPSDYELAAEWLGGYARQHGMLVVLANFGAATGGLASAGRSAIFDPNGGKLAQLGSSGSGLVIARREGSEWRGRALALPEPG